MGVITLVFAVSLGLFTGVLSEDVTFGRHDAARTGESYHLNCTLHVDGVDSTGDWDKNAVPIYDSDTGFIGDAVGRFRVGQEDYDIEVIQMGLDLSGFYTCKLVYVDGGIQKPSGTMNVTALDPAKCTPNKEVQEGDLLNLMCNVTYGHREEFEYKPRVRWYDEYDNLLQGEYVDDPSITVPPTPNHIKTLVYSYPAQAEPSHNDQTFRCAVDFEDKDGMKVLTYEDSCTTHINVKHPPTGIRIHPNKDDIEGNELRMNVGDVFNCTASGHPEPYFEWYREEGSTGGGPSYVEGPNLEVIPDMAGYYNVYRCKATNPAGQGGEAEAVIDFYANWNSGSDSLTPLSWLLLPALLLAGLRVM